MQKIESYRDLIAWQKAMDLVTAVYKVSKLYPGEEQFGLCQQSRRCAVSIPSNIAEGWGRATTADYLKFLRIARGSTYELQTQLLIAGTLGFVAVNHQIHQLVSEVERILNGLIRSIE